MSVVSDVTAFRRGDGGARCSLAEPMADMMAQVASSDKVLRRTLAKQPREPFCCLGWLEEVGEEEPVLWSKYSWSEGTAVCCAVTIVPAFSLGARRSARTFAEFQQYLREAEIKATAFYGTRCARLSTCHLFSKGLYSPGKGNSA